MSVRFHVLLFATLVAACGHRQPTAMDRAAFVRVMADLRQAQRTVHDSDAFDARKREILTQAGVTDSMLMTFVRAHNADAEFMAAVWDTIDRRVNPSPKPGTSPDSGRMP